MGTRKHHRKNKKWSGGANQPAPEKLTQPQVEKLIAQFPEKYTTENVVDPGSTIKKISTDTPVSEIPLEDMNAIKEEAQKAVVNAESQPETQSPPVTGLTGGRRRRRSRKTRKTRRSRRRN
jgi:hypothetical protein